MTFAFLHGNSVYVILAGWFFLFGTAFGSFLNVVVWRVPQKMSLLHPKSHCPRCGHAIRWRHNLPILGWLLLRGRCYDCGESISARYPTVEFLAGVGFLLPSLLLIPAMLDVTMFDATESTRTFLGIGGMWALDVATFLTLLAVAMIQTDGNRVPLRIFIPLGVLFAGLVGFTARVVPLLTACALALPASAVLLFLGWKWDRKNRWPLALCVLFTSLTWVGTVSMYLSAMVAVVVFFATRRRPNFGHYAGTVAFALLLVPLLHVWILVGIQLLLVLS